MNIRLWLTIILAICLNSALKWSRKWPVVSGGTNFGRWYYVVETTWIVCFLTPQLERRSVYCWGRALANTAALLLLSKAIKTYRSYLYMHWIFFLLHLLLKLELMIRLVLNIVQIWLHRVLSRQHRINHGNPCVSLMLLRLLYIELWILLHFNIAVLFVSLHLICAMSLTWQVITSTICAELFRCSFQPLSLHLGICPNDSLLFFLNSKSAIETGIAGSRYT